MRVAFSTDIESTSTAGRHKFMCRLAAAMRADGAEIVDHSPDVYLRFAHHRPRRDASVDVVRLDGLCLQSSSNACRRNRRALRGAERADGVVFQNAFCQRAYRRFLHFEPPLYAEILNGADPADFVPRRPEPIFLANAHWRGFKRLPATIEAFRRLVDADAGVDARLHITGDVDAEHRVNHPRIRYLGAIGDEQLREELARAAASLHLSWLDWCPNAMVEAVVARCPVIYTDSGGHPSIGASAGIAVPDQDWDFTAHAHHDPPPLDIPPVVAAMREVLAGMDVPKRSDLHIANVAARYLAFFEELVQTGRSPRRHAVSTVACRLFG